QPERLARLEEPVPNRLGDLSVCQADGTSREVGLLVALSESVLLSLVGRIHRIVLRLLRRGVRGVVEGRVLGVVSGRASLLFIAVVERLVVGLVSGIRSSLAGRIEGRVVRGR